MPVVNITQRRDTGNGMLQAPPITPTNPVIQPNPEVTRPVVNSNFQDLASSLSDLVPSLRRFTMVQDEMSTAKDKMTSDAAAANTNPDEARAALQQGWGAAVRSGKVPEGASPYFRMNYLQTLGENAARGTYMDSLLANRQDATNPDGTPIDQIISKQRTDFLGQMKGNPLAMEGAMRVLPELEGSIRNDWTLKRTDNQELKGYNASFANGSSILDRYGNAPDDATRAQVMSDYKDFMTQEYKSGRKDLPQFIAKNAVAAAMKMGDPIAARQLLGNVENMETSPGSRLGGIPQIHDMIQQGLMAKDQSSAEADRQWTEINGKAASTTEKNFNNDGMGEIQQQLDANKPLDSGWVSDTLDKLTQKYGGDQTDLTVAKAKFLNDVTNAGGPRTNSNPNALAKVTESINNFQNEDAEFQLNSSYNSGDITLADRTRLQAQIQKGGQMSKIVNDEIVRGNLADAAQTIQATKFPNMGDGYQTAALQAQTQQELQKQMGAEIRKRMDKGQTSDQIYQDRVGLVQDASKNAAQVIGDKVSAIAEDKARANEGAAAQLNAPGTQTNTNKLKSPGLFAPTIEKLEYRSSMLNQLVAKVPSGLTPGQTTQLYSLQKQNNAETATELAKAANNLQTGTIDKMDPSRVSRPFVEGLVDPRAKMTPEDREQVMQDYTRLKNVAGYSLHEVLNSDTTAKVPSFRTSDGVTLPYSVDGKIPGLNPYNTPIFKSTAEMDQAIQDPATAKALQQKLGIEPADYDMFIKRQGLAMIRQGIVPIQSPTRRAIIPLNPNPEVPKK